jgi:glycosyltransferase involved in cell wall biosynthesis
VSDPAGPAICLAMIVRNEAHIVCEMLGSLAPHISSWVIVDTGSEDGTQDVIRDYTARLGIPGELHERPWRNFGHNWTETLQLAHGHGDYIFVLDADDLIIGNPDFTQLSADVYSLRVKGSDSSVEIWRPHIFRSNLHLRIEGVIHEYWVWDEPSAPVRLDGDYHIADRHCGTRSMDPQKYARDAQLLLAEVARRPHDTRSVFYLAQSFFDAGDYVNARKWYARRAEMGGWDEEVFFAMYRLAEPMHKLGEPWPDVLDTCLRAWEYRPTRAEPLHAVAAHYRAQGQYHLGYLFAKRATEIPLPADSLFVNAAVYAWRALDEQAICAFWIGETAESLQICDRLLARPDIPADDRQRIMSNRDAAAALRQAS